MYDEKNCHKFEKHWKDKDQCNDRLGQNIFRLILSWNSGKMPPIHSHYYERKLQKKGRTWKEQYVKVSAGVL